MCTVQFFQKWSYYWSKGAGSRITYYWNEQSPAQGSKQIRRIAQFSNDSIVCWNLASANHKTMCLQISLGIKIGPVEERRCRHTLPRLEGMKFEMELLTIPEAPLSSGTASLSILQILDSYMVQLGETRFFKTNYSPKSSRCLSWLDPILLGGLRAAKGWLFRYAKGLAENYF